MMMLSRINARKALGPDNIPGRVLRDCAVELTDVKTPSVTEWRKKKPWEKPGSVGGPVLLWPGYYCLFIVYLLF